MPTSDEQKLKNREYKRLNKEKINEMNHKYDALRCVYRKEARRLLKIQIE